MDFKQYLKGPVAKVKSLEVRDEILKHPHKLHQLMDIFLGQDYRMCQNAAMAISKIGDEQPGLIEPFIGRMIAALDHNPIDAVKRNVVRLLQFQSVDEKHQGKLANHCFEYLSDRKTPIAIRVFSMTVLAQLCLQYPDLKPELILMIKEELPMASAGFRSRARKILNQIES